MKLPQPSSLYRALVTAWPVQAGLRKKYKVLTRNFRLALRHPDLFDDAVQSRKLTGIDALVKDKRVAVVGNASCLLDHPTGAEIDAHDVVIRFNKGFIVDPVSQGNRTTIHCLATDIPIARIDASWPNAALFYVSPVRSYLHADLLRTPSRYACLPLADWKRLSVFMDDLRPSAGMLIIDYLLHRAGASQIALYGFDWKRSKTFYHGSKIEDWHSGEAERKIVLEWARAYPERICLDACPMHDLP